MVLYLRGTKSLSEFIVHHVLVHIQEFQESTVALLSLSFRLCNTPV